MGVPRSAAVVDLLHDRRRQRVADAGSERAPSLDWWTYPLRCRSSYLRHELRQRNGPPKALPRARDEPPSLLRTARILKTAEMATDRNGCGDAPRDNADAGCDWARPTSANSGDLLQKAAWPSARPLDVAGQPYSALLAATFGNAVWMRTMPQGLLCISTHLDQFAVHHRCRSGPRRAASEPPRHRGAMPTQYYAIAFTRLHPRRCS